MTGGMRVTGTVDDGSTTTTVALVVVVVAAAVDVVVDGGAVLPTVLVVEAGTVGAAELLDAWGTAELLGEGVEDEGAIMLRSQAA